MSFLVAGLEQELRRAAGDGSQQLRDRVVDLGGDLGDLGLPSPAKTLLGWSKVMMAWSAVSLRMTTRSGATACPAAVISWPMSMIA